MIVRSVTLDDWTEIRALQKKVEGSRAERFIFVDDANLQAYFFNSHIFPDRVGLLGLWSDGSLVGMVALFMVDTPQMCLMGCPLQRHAFIHSVYIRPRAAVRAGEFFLEHMCQWASQRGATMIFGNIFPRQGRVDSFKRKYGFVEQHVVIGKETRYGKG